MNGAALIAGHPDAETVTLIRAVGPVQDASGVFEESAAVETPLRVVLHPLSGEDAVMVPEADRVTSTIEVYATQALRVARDGLAADKLRRADNKVYRVAKVDEQKGGVWLMYAHLEEPA